MNVSHVQKRMKPDMIRCQQECKESEWGIVWRNDISHRGWSNDIISLRSLATDYGHTFSMRHLWHHPKYLV